MRREGRWVTNAAEAERQNGRLRYDDTVDYWQYVFTPNTWGEFNAAGAALAGFSQARAHLVRQISPGDRLLCWLKTKRGYISALETTGPSYQSESPIWGSDAFPVRVPVRPLVMLDAQHPMPFTEVIGKTSLFPSGVNLATVSSKLQGSPNRLPFADGEVILSALRVFEDGVAPSEPSPGPIADRAVAVGQERQHSEIQLLLAEWGVATGCRIWIPKSDRLRVQRLHVGKSPLPLAESLPLLPSDPSRSILENIDVIWLSKQSIVAAFEVEQSTTIYSGLLRMSDLVATMSHLSIGLYIVAPEARRHEVERQVTRPTFESLDTPLSKACGFISYESLRERFVGIGNMLSSTKPQAIKNIAVFFEGDTS